MASPAYVYVHMYTVIYIKGAERETGMQGGRERERERERRTHTQGIWPAK